MTAKKTKPKAKSENPVGRFARVVDAAFQDADAARKHALSPAFRRAVTADRRSALSRFRTVQQALADRRKIEREKARRSGGAAPRPPKKASS